MKVVKPHDGTVNAERRLVRAMLCMEHGAVAVGADLASLPPPHAPWPTVALGPVTEQGFAAVAHYKPTVGVVFYTAGESFSIRDFVERIARALRAAPDDHLRGYRDVAATPFAVVQHKNRVGGGTAVTGPRSCYKKALAEKDGLPARLLIWTPPEDEELPPHYSVRAGFTWVFMPVTVALAAAATGINTMAAFNAAVASLLYDSAMMSTLADGTDFERLTPADFDCPPLPAFLSDGLGPGAGPVPATGPTQGALVVAGGALSYVGHHRCLRAAGRAPVAGALPRDFAALAPRPWDPAAVATRAPGRYQCVACDAPIGGDAALLLNPRAPKPSNHREWYYYALDPGTPLAPGAGGFLLCLACWGALDSPACVTRHLDAAVARVLVPQSQAEACAACPGYECLGPILGAHAEPVPGAPGAFVVRPRAAGAREPAPLVLAAENLGKYPALTNAAVAALRLPVLTGLRIAEVRGGQDPAPAPAPTPAPTPAPMPAFTPRRGLEDVHEDF